MESIIDFFIESYSNKSYNMIILELIAFLFGVISVVYAKRPCFSHTFPSEACHHVVRFVFLQHTHVPDINSHLMHVRRSCDVC